MSYHKTKMQAGFSVVEVMIAMLLSLALATAVITVFVNNSYSFGQDDNISRMQDDARHALREIAFEISMAGHYADLHMPEMVTPDGFSAAECAKRLSDAGADIVGVNCMRDPERTYPIIEQMRGATDAYLAAQPVAYACSNETPWFTGTAAFPDRLEPTRMTRYEMSEFAIRARDMGVNYIGSCCGSGAVHVREMARALGKISGEEDWTPDPENPMSDTEYNWRRVRDS